MAVSFLPSFRPSIMDDETAAIAAMMTPHVDTLMSSFTPAEYDFVIAALDNDDNIALVEFMGAKYFQRTVAVDPFHIAMKKGLKWGDMLYGVRLRDRSKMGEDEEPINPDAGWEMPALRLRKDIWENFPVVVVPIASKSDSDRYAIRWHHKNFKEQRETVEHFWQWEDFEEDTYRRLIKAVSASRYWTVEVAESAEDLCVISMNHQSAEKVVAPLIPASEDLNDSASVTSDVSDASSVSSGWEQVPVRKTEAVRKAPAASLLPTPPAHFIAPVSAGPIATLRRLNDIKENFPVIWSEVHTGNPARKVYGIEIFGKKARELGLNTNTVQKDLLAALKASPSWTVLSTVSGNQVAQIEMKIKTVA
jgi:hypothetical protein